MLWAPYTDQILDSLPLYCQAGRHIWRTRSPLIHFHIVEFHLPDRVMRQFGLRQFIPDMIDTDVRLHRSTLSSGRSCRRATQRYIDDWGNRDQRIVGGEEDVGPLLATSPYMTWYRRITRIYIGPRYHAPPLHGFQPEGERTESVLQTLYRCVDVGNERLHAEDDMSEATRRALSEIVGVLSDLGGHLFHSSQLVGDFHAPDAPLPHPHLPQFYPPEDGHHDFVPQPGGDAGYDDMISLDSDLSGHDVPHTVSLGGQGSQDFFVGESSYGPGRDTSYETPPTYQPPQSPYMDPSARGFRPYTSRDYPDLPPPSTQDTQDPISSVYSSIFGQPPPQFRPPSPPTDYDIDYDPTHQPVRVRARRNTRPPRCGTGGHLR